MWKHIARSKIYKGDLLSFINAASRPYLCGGQAAPGTEKAQAHIFQEAKAYVDRNQHGDAQKAAPFLVDNIHVCGTAYFCLSGIPKSTFYT